MRSKLPLKEAAVRGTALLRAAGYQLVISKDMLFRTKALNAAAARSARMRRQPEPVDIAVQAARGRSTRLTIGMKAEMVELVRLMTQLGCPGG
jgi:hypothetical protein